MHSFTRTVGEQASIFRKPKNQLIGQIQALKAQLIGMWMVVEAMEKHVKPELVDQSND
jgi:hypothetical protein